MSHSRPCHHLYFVHNPQLDIVKIGRTDDIERRLKELECDCGVSLHLLRVIEFSGHREKRIHDALAADRLLGEWFRMSDEIRHIVSENATVNECLRFIYYQRVDRFLPQPR